MAAASSLDLVIAITGASSGIGRAIAELAAAEGAAVVLSARRADLLHDIVARITAHGGRAVAVPSDVTRESDMTMVVARAVEAFGRLDVMVCNAGIGYHDRFDATTSEAMRALVDVNVMGTLYAARAAMTQFTRQGRGHVIAMSSVNGRRGIPGSAVYSATKFAQVGLIEGLRAEQIDTNIHASVVFPVSTRTEFREAARRRFGQEVHGRGPQQSAEVVARAVLRCMREPTPEVYTYAPAKWLAILSVIAPRLADRLATRYERRAR